MRIRRVRYVRAGDATIETGPLELSFEDGGIALFDAAGDGEQLTIDTEPWRDPFADPMSEENRAFVDSHGKWTAFDVSAEEGFRSIIGTSAADTSEIVNADGRMTGVEFLFPLAVLRVDVQFDELVVDVSTS